MNESWAGRHLIGALQSLSDWQVVTQSQTEGLPPLQRHAPVRQGTAASPPASVLASTVVSVVLLHAALDASDPASEATSTYLVSRLGFMSKTIAKAMPTVLWRFFGASPTWRCHDVPRGRAAVLLDG